MSDVTLLRKLTLKSTLKFGKEPDVPICNLIDNQQTVYLRWVYFNCDKITFMDDVLDLIFVPLEYRIEKPGKKPDLHEKLCDEIQSRFTWFAKQHHKKRGKAINYNKKSQNMRVIAKINSKASLTRKNQGH